MTCSVFIACSLDGFIAREDGGIDWLTESGGSNEDKGEDYGYQKFISSVDAIVMGRNTFEKVRTFEPWPYDKPVVVLTHRDLNLPGRLTDKVSVLAGTPHEIVEKLANDGLNRLYIDGGRTISSFIKAGLILEMTITRIPIILGCGIPLFSSMQSDIKLNHISTHSYPNGLVQNRYQIIQNG